MIREMDVDAQGLTKAFGATTVLRGVDLAVARGTVLALLGPNGAGKTTTVRILIDAAAPGRGPGSAWRATTSSGRGAGSAASLA